MFKALQPRWWPQTNLWFIPFLVAIFRQNSSHGAPTDLYARCRPSEEKKPYCSTLSLCSSRITPLLHHSQANSQHLHTYIYIYARTHTHTRWRTIGNRGAAIWNSQPVDCAPVQHLNTFTSRPCIWLVYISITHLHNHQQQLDECSVESLQWMHVEVVWSGKGTSSWWRHAKKIQINQERKKKMRWWGGATVAKADWKSFSS